MNSGTVLVVDDDPEALELLVTVLETEGYQVQPADSGRLALISFAARPPDLVLLDVRMPAMDGFEICRQLKADDAFKRIPVIFVSSSRNRAEWAEGLSLGAVDFVSKPFQREELLARVKTHLELGRFQANLESLVVQRTADLSHAIEQMKIEMAERRHAEQALRESEERFRQIATAAPVIIWTANGANTVDFRNEYATQVTGRAMEELIGPGWTEVVHPEDRARQQELFRQALETREKFQFEYRLQRSDGTYRYVLDLGVPRFLADGEFAGFIGIVFDLTDIRISQEQAYRERNLENLRVLSAGIAHDFNSLIGAIFGEVDLALSDMMPNAPGRDSVQRIDGVARRAAEIVRLLLAYVGDRQDANLLQIVDINEVLQEIVPHLKGPILRRAEFRMNLAAQAAPVTANLAQIRLVVLNLVMNAAEALEEKKGLVTIATSQVKICPECAETAGLGLPDGTYLKLEISDNGRGVTDEVRDRMFDPYYSTKLLGRGLGLAVVKGIIRSHHGNVRVRSAPGHGSTFEVLLPSGRHMPGGAG